MRFVWKKHSYSDRCEVKYHFSVQISYKVLKITNKKVRMSSKSNNSNKIIIKVIQGKIIAFFSELLQIINLFVFTIGQIKILADALAELKVMVLRIQSDEIPLSNRFPITYEKY